jgi:hypothetical protein
MADWRRLAWGALLCGHHIDDRKVALLRKELFADRRIDRSEIEFLLQAKRAAHSAVPAFQALVLEALRSYILTDGVIDADEAAWLRAWIFADGKVDADEKKLLKELKLLADRVSPEFQKLYDECMAS